MVAHAKRIVVGDSIIARTDTLPAGVTAGMPMSGLSVHFAGGDRPDVAAIVRLAGAVADGHVPDSGRFSISHSPAASAAWVELLASGLTFDLSGLAPGEGVSPPPPGHLFGFDQPPTLPAGGALNLAVGAHLSGGGGLLPVVRTMVALGARLARLEGAVAVGWHPARSVIAAGLFCRMIDGWLAGGAFPALGLTALARDPDGGLRSEGLAHFIGQELRIEPYHGEPLADAAKLALRLIHDFVERGPVSVAFETTGLNGAPLLVEPSANRSFIRVWRRD
jgi:hypothetical protein